eukprot:1432071-Prymnesium_polylepis.1
MSSDASVREPARPRQAVRSSCAAATPLPASIAARQWPQSFQVDRPTKIYRQPAAVATMS